MKLGLKMSCLVQRRCLGVVFAFALLAPGSVWADAKITFNLKEADIGILFKPNKNISKEFPNLSTVNSYDDIKKQLAKFVHD